MQNAEMQVQVVLNMLHNMRIAVSTAYANVTAAHERYQQGENILENLKNVWHYLDDMNDILSALTARRTNTRAFHEVTYIKHLMRGLGKKADIRSIHSIYFNDRDTYKQQIRCDEVLLTHALWNVILNGHESTEEKYGTSSTQAAVRVKSYIKGGYLCVLITDNGTGIKKVDGSFNYIFESGYTTKGSKRLFAGEGLSTFTKIVHNHHGRHQVYSREGWGTCFKIMLPLVGSPEIAR
jgi:signal transduction histidine kinase